MKTYLLKSLKQAKRLIIVIVGISTLLVGVAMLVLPGPAIVVIPVGLAILATEFVWARNILKKVKAMLQKTKEGDMQ
jgi:uncharacterized protein (TIGR02611 family)